MTSTNRRPDEKRPRGLGNAKRHRLAAACWAVALPLLLAGCDASINKSIEIADGETVGHGLTSVNGGIRIGDGAEVGGGSTTVNGSIRVGEGAKVGELTTVNGSIRLDRNVEVDGDVESVNGSFGSDEGSTIDGGVQTINGSIDLDGTEVARDVTTHNGDVTLRRGSRIGGDVVIEKVTGSGGRGRLDVELFDGSVIEGDVRVEGERRVTVTIEEGSEVRGEIVGAEVEERPAPSPAADEPAAVEAEPGG